MKKRHYFVKIAIITSLILFCFPPLFSQETDSEKDNNESFTDLGADLVTSYLWRGILIDATPNIQGWGEFGVGGFTLGAWASANFTGTFAETDLYTGYAVGNFSASLTNYFTGRDDFYNLEKNSTTHAGELILQYTLSENLPLQFTWGTVIYGADKKPDTYTPAGDTITSDKNNYSSYFELMYPITHGETEIKFVLGGVTHASQFYGTDGFGIINVGVNAAKEVKITDSFSLPMSFGLTTNPNEKKFLAVFSISF